MRVRLVLQGKNMSSRITITQTLVCAFSSVAVLGAVSIASPQILGSSDGAESFLRMRAAGRGMMLYVEDNDQYFPFSDSGSPVGWGVGRPDYVWYELIVPYIGSYTPTESPFDPFKISQQHLDPLTGAQLSQKDPNYWYAVAERSNIGLNFEFLSPWTYDNNRIHWPMSSRPTGMGQVAQPSKTLLFASSVWDRDSNGQPVGGGSWTIEAPCFRDSNGTLLEPMKSIGITWYTYGGWTPGSQSFLQYGAMWPWFKPQKFQYMMLDGTVRATDLGPLTAGCDVQPHGTGRAFDGDAYIWDLR